MGKNKSVAAEKMHQLWGRFGTTLNVTDEELRLPSQGDKNTLVSVLEDTSRWEFDGEAHFPEELEIEARTGKLFLIASSIARVIEKRERRGADIESLARYMRQVRHTWRNNKYILAFVDGLARQKGIETKEGKDDKREDSRNQGGSRRCS